jgi:rhodanese-related sulfurtransferase
MVEEMDPETLAGKLEAGEAVQVIDIRSPGEFARGHVPGAINVPFATLVQEIESVEWDDEIVVACPIGQSSQQAAKLIESYEGVSDDSRVYNLTGGYRAWDGTLETAGSEDEPGSDGVDAPF